MWPKQHQAPQSQSQSEVLHPIPSSISILSSPPRGGRSQALSRPLPALTFPSQHGVCGGEQRAHTHGPVNVKPWQPASESRQEPSQHKGQQNQAAINYEQDARW